MSDANPALVEGAVKPFVAACRERLLDVSERTRALVVQHPLPAVGSAVGLGFLLARIVRRS